MAFDWTAPDGITFSCEEWLPPQPPRAILLCLHGLGGAAGDFRPIGETAVNRGMAGFAVNLRGQGSDPVPARRGASLDLLAVAQDIEMFLRHIRCGREETPVFVCGESMGALITAWMIAQGKLGEGIRGLVLSVPVIELGKPTPWAIRQALRGLAMVLPHGRFYPSWFVSGKSEPLKVTRDEEHQRWVRSAPHYIRAFTFRFLNALGNLMESSSALATKITLPSLVLAAGSDVFLRPEQVRAWFDKLASTDKTFRLYPEAYHLLWNDWDREIVLDDIFAWLEERLPSRLETESPARPSKTGPRGD